MKLLRSILRGNAPPERMRVAHHKPREGQGARRRSDVSRRSLINGHRSADVSYDNRGFGFVNEMSVTRSRINGMAFYLLGA